MTIVTGCNQAKLFYIHDPMCAWCWGFRPSWQQLKDFLKEKYPQLRIEYVAGGLAPDTDQPMPIETQRMIQDHWYRIKDLLGTEFNFDFWLNNEPRRSTYNACRAVIAAYQIGQKIPLDDTTSQHSNFSEKLQDEMMLAIQRGYYQRALNPSDLPILMLLFDEVMQALSLDMTWVSEFQKMMTSAELHQQLIQQVGLARQLTTQGFPSLVLLSDQAQYHSITVDYQNWQSMADQVQAHLNG
jgi:putative protein-disulfide isomerase